MLAKKRPERVGQLSLKIPVRLINEFQSLAQRQKARGVRYVAKTEGRPMSQQGVLGCLLLDVLARPKGEQDAIVDRWLSTLEEMWDEEGKNGGEGPTPREGETPVVESRPAVYRTEETPLKKPRGRPKKSG